MVYYSHITMAVASDVDILYRPTLSGPSQEAAAASALRRERSSNANLIPDRVGRNVPQAGSQSRLPHSALLRQGRQQNAKDAAQAGPIAGVFGRATDVATTAINRGTSEFLKKMWQAAPETYGLSILYVNVHWGLNKILGDKFFCPLGDEWFQSNPATKTGGKNVGSESILGIPKKGAGMLEGGVLVTVDAIVLALILINLAFVVLMAWMVEHPLDALWQLGFGPFWQMMKTAWNLKG